MGADVRVHGSSHPDPRLRWPHRPAQPRRHELLSEMLGGSSVAAWRDGGRRALAEGEWLAAEVAKSASRRVATSRTGRRGGPGTSRPTSPLARGRGERLMVVVRDGPQMVTLQESLRRSESLSAMGSLVAGRRPRGAQSAVRDHGNLDVFEAKLGDRADCAEMMPSCPRGRPPGRPDAGAARTTGRPPSRRASRTARGSPRDAIAPARSWRARTASGDQRTRGRPPVVMDRNRIGRCSRTSSPTPSSTHPPVAGC